ncbi:UNVERIFIED_CONTAM: dipeptidyl aminopeptidase/acylaminoacyl peptidase [Brevibacillus sp. OAP136]
MITFQAPDISQFIQPYEIKCFAVSPDERHVVWSCNSSGVFNLWAIDEQAAAPYQLTQHHQASDAIQIVASSEQKQPFILFTSDQDGDENMQIYAVAAHGGVPLPVRYDEGKRYFFGTVSEDGKRLYYGSNKENPLYLNIYCYDMESGDEQLLLTGVDAETHFQAISPDEQSLAYFVRYNHTNMKGYVRSGEQTLSLIPDATEEHKVANLTFANDEMVYFLTNYKEEYNYLASFSLKTGAFKKVMSIPAEEIASFQLTQPSGDIYLATSRGVRDSLYRYNVATKECEKLSIPVDVIYQWMVTETKTVYVLGSSPTKPANLYRKKADAKWQKITENRVPGASEHELVEPEVVYYDSYDGTRIESLYYPAKKEMSNGHTIVFPHGGPQFLERKEYYGWFQYFAAKGYNLFIPNFRGSTNYGTRFMKLIEGDWGGGPRRDIIWGIESLIQLGKMTRDQIIVMGASYGGYMSLLLFGRHPGYFVACVDICGPTNLFTMVESVPDHWKARMDSWIGNPIRDRERLIEQSPVTYLDNMKKPVMVVQGANDPRVKKEESDQIVEGLRAKDIEVDYLVFPDEGHGFGKKANEIKAVAEISRFLDQVIHKNSEEMASSSMD